MSFRNTNHIPNDAELGEEAADWLLRLKDTEIDPEDEYPDIKSRNNAFYDWLGMSPEHLRVFLEIIETHRRLPMIDSRHLIRVEGLLQDRMADVIQLHKQKSARGAHPCPDDGPSRSGFARCHPRPHANAYRYGVPSPLC